MGTCFKISSFKIFNSSSFFRRAIMEDIKPKKVLTEAQRLAFLKGREKRMANIEKKRLEKEEQLPDPPMPEVKRHEPTPAPAPAPAPTPEPAPAPAPTFSFDESKIADTIAERVLAKLETAKPKRKPYTRKPAKSAPSSPAPVPPPTHSFTWM